MRDLDTIQKTFLQSILEKNLADLSFVKSTYPVERLDIYRQTIFENTRNSLAITFPGVWKLLGEECANSAAYTFCKHKQNLPISGCLDDFGENFPKFLGVQKELQELPYLKDYAYFEWLKHQSYMAKDIAPITNLELTAIPAGKIEETGFTLIPSVFIFTAEFSIEKIQKIVEDPSSQPINLDTQKTYAIIARPASEVLVFWISKDLWQFINFITQGLNLAEITLKMDELDLTKAMHFLLQNQLISQIIIKGENYHD